MKGHKAKRATGGVAEYEEDLKDHPMAYNKSKVEDEAEERKAGGRAKRKSGGKAIGKVEGSMAKHRMDRKPRKSGGACEDNVFSSARGGKSPYGAERVE